MLLGLNLTIAGLSELVAVPVHRRAAAEGALSGATAAALMRVNGVRLAVATLSVLASAGLAWAHLT